MKIILTYLQSNWVYENNIPVIGKVIPLWKLFDFSLLSPGIYMLWCHSIDFESLELQTLSRELVNSFDSMQKSHFRRLPLRSHSFGHNPKLMPIGENGNKDGEKYSKFTPALLIWMSISSSCVPSLVNMTPRYLNFSTCFSFTPPTCREVNYGQVFLKDAIPQSWQC